MQTDVTLPAITISCHTIKKSDWSSTISYLGYTMTFQPGFVFKHTINHGIWQISETEMAGKAVQRINTHTHTHTHSATARRYASHVVQISCNMSTSNNVLSWNTQRVFAPHSASNHEYLPFAHPNNRVKQRNNEVVNLHSVCLGAQHWQWTVSQVPPRHSVELTAALRAAKEGIQYYKCEVRRRDSGDELLGLAEV